MFVSILLNTEYMDVASRSKWYLKNLLHCKENGWPLITHRYLGEHFRELQDAVNDRFFREFEMRRFSLDEVKDVEQYFLDDSLFDEKEEACGSRTKMLLDITQERWPEFEEHLGRILDAIREKHPGERIEGILHCLEGFESLRYIARKRQIPLISYVFSAIRRPHGYRQTLYFSNFDRLFCSDECENRYQHFLSESGDCPVLDHRELIALLGKERTLPLIPLMDKEPEFEVCICGEGFHILPHIFARVPLTDDDLYYEYGKLFPGEKIISRQHPLHLDQIGVDRSVVRNDPASTILSCRRVATGCSQIILKAMLWNRTAVMPKNTIPLSFMCEKKYDSVGKVPLLFLNYYLFGYLIPSGLLFDDSYWKWRLSGPDEHSIYRKHLAFICQDLAVDPAILDLPQGDGRFSSLLEARDVDRDLADRLLDGPGPENVSFATASSKFEIDGKAYWRLNEVDGGRIKSRIKVYGAVPEELKFYPYDDVAGVSRLVAVHINGTSVDADKLGVPVYMPKVSGSYAIRLPSGSAGPLTVECIWETISIKSYLNN